MACHTFLLAHGDSKRSSKPANQQTHKPASKKPRTQETKHNTARHKGFLPVSLLIHDQTAIAVRTEKNWPQLTPQSHGPSPRGVVLDNTSRERQKGLQKPPVFKSQSHIVRFVVKISVPCGLDFRSQWNHHTRHYPPWYYVFRFLRKYVPV